MDQQLAREGVNLAELEHMTVAEALAFLANKEKLRITKEFELAKVELTKKFNKTAIPK